MLAKRFATSYGAAPTVIDGQKVVLSTTNAANAWLYDKSIIDESPAKRKPQPLKPVKDSVDYWALCEQVGGI